MQKINIKKIIEATDQDAFINQLQNITFKRHPRGYRCKESSGLTLFKDRQTDKWICKNHSDKLDIPSGDIWTFTKRLHNETGADHESIESIAKHICEAQGIDLSRFIDIDYRSYQKPYKQAKKGAVFARTKTEVWNPNNAGYVNTHYEYKTVSWCHTNGKAVLKYFDKFGISQSTLIQYGVHPLESIRHIKTGRIKTFRRQDQAYAYIQSGNIKFKHPGARNKRYKDGYIQSTGNYIFGLDQLPDRCNKIIIAAGEKDTIALNHHLNRHGIYAICFNSESAHIPTDIIKYLRSKCNKLICLFDNDSTGEKHSRINARLHGIGFIRIADTINDPLKYNGNYESGINKTLNDVCDILEHHGVTLLESIINGHVHRDSTPDDIRISFDTYLSESIEAIKKGIQNNDKLILKAPTGGGKSFALLEIAQDHEYLKSINCQYGIFCVPTNTIAEQLQSEARAKGIDIPIVNGKWTKEASEQYAGSKIYIAVYDSLRKLDDIIFHSLFIIDESHLLFDANGYRQNAIVNVWDYLNEAKKAVLISATPYKLPGVPLMNAIQKNGQTFNITPVYYDGNKLNFSFLKAHSNDGVHIVRINDIELLKALQSKLGGEAAILSSAENGRYKESNPVYQSIIETGKVPDGFKYLLVTSLIDTGVSIISSIASIHLFDCYNDNEVLQAIARARRRKGLNDNIRVYVYHKAKLNEYESIEAQHMDGKEINLYDIVNDLEEKAQEIKDRHNEILKISKTISDDINLKESPNKLCYFSNIKNQYEVYIPGVHYEAYKQYRSQISNDQFYKDIVSKNPNITINDPVLMTFTGDLSKAVKHNKEIRKENQSKAYDIFLSDPDAICEAVYHTTKDGKLKQHIRNKKYPEYCPGHLALHYIRNHSELFAAGYFDKPVRRYIEILNTGISSKEAAGHVYNNQGRKQWNVIYNAVTIAHRVPDNKAPGATIIRGQAKQLYEAYRATGKKEFTITQLKKLLIKAGYNSFDTNDKDIVYLRFAELFKTEKYRVNIEGRKQTVYRIGKKWTKEALKTSANILNEIAEPKPAQSIEYQRNEFKDTDIRPGNNTIKMINRLSTSGGIYCAQPVPF